MATLASHRHADRPLRRRTILPGECEGGPEKWVRGAVAILPGFDPCELFYNPRLAWPRGRVLLRLLQRRIGFRALFDLVPLEPGLVRGSHGLPAAQAVDRPLLIGDGPAPGPAELTVTSVHALLRAALLGEA